MKAEARHDELGLVTRRASELRFRVGQTRPFRLRPALLAALLLSLLAVAPGSVRAADGGTPLEVAGMIAPRPFAGGAVHRALARRERVPVLVTLRGRGLPSARHLRARRGSVATLQQRVLERLAGAGFELTARWRATPGFAGTVTRRGLARLLASPYVLRVDVDRRVHATMAESAPLIRADQVHATGVTGQGVTVAVVDSGIDTDNPDLADDLVDEVCFTHSPSGGGGCPNGQTRQAGPGSAEDDEGHGTSVSSIVTSRGTVAPRGVAPDAKIVAVKVLASDGAGTVADIVAGLDWILNHRVDIKVVNMSLGSDAVFPGPCDGADAVTIAYASVLNALRARGVTVFTASGNSGSSSGMGSPACVGAAVSVGAVYDSDLGSESFGDTCTDTTSAADKVICFTDADATLDLLAPGGAITSAQRGGGVDTGYGTSAATPHAAGVAALMLQARSDLTPDQLETTLEQTGIPVTDARNGVVVPRIDALAAVNAVPGLPPPPPLPAYLPAGSSTFPDGTGETRLGPELGSVSITATPHGVLLVKVATSNRTTRLNFGDVVRVFFDVDRNRTTGDGGADYAVVAPARDDVLLLRWTGSSWQVVRPLAEGVFVAGTLTFPITQDELGARSDFGFWVNSDWARGSGDRNPDAGAWPYPAVPLTVAKAGTGAGAVTGGGINCGTFCAALLARGETTSLTATASAGSAFVEWTGACTGSGACTPAGAGAAAQVTARFELLRRVTVTKQGTGRGTVGAGPTIACGATCAATAPHGTALTLTAQADPGSRFRAWGGSCAGSAACELAVDGDEAITADFVDVAKPDLRLLRSAGRVGRRVRLRYRIRDNGASVRVEVTVYVRGRKVAAFRRGPTAPDGDVESVAWKSPARPAGRARFCVRATDLAGNRSTRRCARVGLS